MTVPMPDLMPALPEIILVLGSLAILMVDAFVTDVRRSPAYGLSLLLVLVLAITTLSTYQDDGIIFTFNGMFVRDALGDVLKLVIYACVAAMMMYSQQFLRERGMFRGEFFILILFALLGMMVMTSASNLLSLYVGLELLSLSLYALVATDRDNPVATEAAMKYFVLGAIASGMLLYGMSMLYGVTGLLDISGIAQALPALWQDRSPALALGLVFIVAGLAFKLGVVPFHMWVPDVYEGSPTAVTLLIASAPKIAGFAMLFRLLVNGLIEMATDWQQMFMLLAVLSVFIGNILALSQTNLKRMLAYSTISHMGFVLIGMLSGVQGTRTTDMVDAYSASMFYVIVYSVTSLAAFSLILLFARVGYEADTLDDLKGLSKRNPWLAWMVLLIMFSLAGIPPMVGFWAKFGVLQSAVHAGYISLAVLAVIASLIGAFYYLRIVKLMFFDEPLADAAVLRADTHVQVLFSCNSLAVLAFGLSGQWLLSICEQSMMHSLF